MPTKRTPKKAKRPDPTLEERGEQYERERLRRRRDHQRRIAMLARSLRRVTDIANRERIAMAQSLIAGTGFKLIDPSEFARWQRQHDDAERRLEELGKRIVELEHARELVKV